MNFSTILKLLPTTLPLYVGFIREWLLIYFFPTFSKIWWQLNMTSQEAKNHLQQCRKQQMLNCNKFKIVTVTVYDFLSFNTILIKFEFSVNSNLLTSQISNCVIFFIVYMMLITLPKVTHSELIFPWYHFTTLMRQTHHLCTAVRVRISLNI